MPYAFSRQLLCLESRESFSIREFRKTQGEFKLMLCFQTTSNISSLLGYTLHEWKRICKLAHKRITRPNRKQCLCLTMQILCLTPENHQMTTLKGWGPLPTALHSHFSHSLPSFVWRNTYFLQCFTYLLTGHIMINSLIAIWYEINNNRFWNEGLTSTNKTT